MVSHYCNSNLERSFLFRFYPFLFLLIFSAISFRELPYRSLDGIIWSDAEGYYLYLPAVFIYQGFEGIPYRTKVQFSNYPGTEKLFTKYTCGVALMQLPFFLVAHQLSQIRGLPVDGYSLYYKFSILAAGIFYAFLGIVFLRRVLERYFDPVIVLLTLFCLIFGTSAFYYTVGEAGMSHMYSFFLFALFMYLTPRFLEGPSWGMVVAMGLLSGLIVLIRPTNVVIGLYALLYQVGSWSDFKARLGWIGRNFGRLWLFPLCSFLLFLPQLWYWKYISGDFVIYSYGEEGFTHWKNPKIMHVLFDITNGWLLFSPVAGVALAGLYQGVCRRLYNIPVIALITGISLYLFASWWMWFFGGAFGYRPMIEFYALLAIPFALFAREVYRGEGSSLVWKIVFSLMLVIMVYYTQGLIFFKNGPHYNWWTWKVAVDQLFPFLGIL